MKWLEDEEVQSGDKLDTARRAIWMYVFVIPDPLHGTDGLSLKGVWVMGRLDVEYLKVLSMHKEVFGES